MLKRSLAVVEWQFRLDFVWLSYHQVFLSLVNVSNSSESSYRWLGNIAVDIEVWIVLAATQLILGADPSILRCPHLIEMDGLRGFELRHQISRAAGQDVVC